MTAPLPRRCLAEFIGTALLVATVVGSGIAATRLSPHDVGLELFENAAATAAILVALILTFGSVSGAHFNPIVTLVVRQLDGGRSRDAVAYIGAQITGGVLGTMVAHIMFGLHAVAVSEHNRSAAHFVVAEVVATFGLVVVAIGTGRAGRGDASAYAVGAYIGAAYFFTSSTSFANPAVTIARTLTKSFSGIAPRSGAAFIAAQLAGGIVAALALTALFPRGKADAV